MILIGNCILLESRLRIDELVLALYFICGFGVKQVGIGLLLNRTTFIANLLMKAQRFQRGDCIFLRKKIALKPAVSGQAWYQGDEVHTFNEFIFRRIAGNPLNSLLCEAVRLKVLIAKDGTLSFVGFL